MQTGDEPFVVYLDSSAIVKLVVTEPESSALRGYLARHAERVSSGLARVEVLRALRRTGSSQAVLHHAARILERIALVAVDEPILHDAAALEPRPLRSLDAVHLATALSLDGLEAVVTYDRRLHDAAAEAGLQVVLPT